jgi:hypothetical protein
MSRFFYCRFCLAFIKAFFHCFFKLAKPVKGGKNTCFNLAVIFPELHDYLVKFVNPFLTGFQFCLRFLFPLLQRGIFNGQPLNIINCFSDFRFQQFDLFKINHVLNLPVLNPSGERSFCFGYHFLKSRGIFNCQMRQGFPVDYNTCFVKPIYKPGIGNPFFTAGGVNSYNPQFAEIAFAVPPVAV